MTVGEFITYIDCMPVPDENILDMKIMFKVPSVTGQYTRLINPVRPHVEATQDNKEIIVFDTGYVDDVD